MAMAVAYKVHSADTTNGTSYAFSSFTPAANSILVAGIISIASDGVTMPTMSDAEGAWTRFGSTYNATTARLFTWFWRKVDATPVAITPTFDSTGDSLNGILGVIWEFIPDVVVAGSPVRQTAYTTEANVANAVITFGSALQTANGYAMMGYSDNNPYAMDAPPTGWTQDVDTGMTTPTIGLWGGHRAGGETGTTITATDAAITRSTIGIEIFNNEPPASGERQIIARGVARGISRGLR